MKSLFLFIALYAFTACAPKDKLVYFYNNTNNLSQVSSIQQTKIKTNDLISVLVTAEDLESVIPFNYPNSFISSGGAGAGIPYNFGRPSLTGYLVDVSGNVKLPVIGDVYVLNMSITELKNKLELIYKEFVNNPVVIVRLENFKVSVIGDVRLPGTFQIPNEKVSIIEAIGMAGDLNITALRNNILVIREKDGIKNQYRFDLTDANCVNSEVYFLEQNDIVYVEPNYTQRTQSSFIRQTAPLFTSISALFVSSLFLILNFN
jgi:polysaccharide export outer membrane protein